ncbi:MAG: hypothetical protein LM583_07655, partial [Desulfurococcaceae archaeon]|nr:hypothetical protein [Desulfurococcaceae archaeon]
MKLKLITFVAFSRMPTYLFQRSANKDTIMMAATAEEISCCEELKCNKCNNEYTTICLEIDTLNRFTDELLKM